MQAQFRAQIFASMRFNENGPLTEAKLLRDKLALHGVHLHIIAPRPGESIDSAVFNTMAQCDAFLAMATKDYGADTGNTASTFHEVRTWKENYNDKPLIPLRMFPWDAEFEHETARELFGSNVLSLKWIKGEPTPGGLVDDILRGLGLERETETQVRQRRAVPSPLGVDSRRVTDAAGLAALDHEP